MVGASEFEPLNAYRVKIKSPRTSMRNYTEGVHKRKGKIVYDGVLAYYDEHGKRKFAHRERNTQSAAREALRKLRHELEERGPKALESNVVTFAQLADYCEKEIYVEAEYNSAK